MYAKYLNDADDEDVGGFYLFLLYLFLSEWCMSITPIPPPADMDCKGWLIPCLEAPRPGKEHQSLPRYVFRRPITSTIRTTVEAGESRRMCVCNATVETKREKGSRAKLQRRNSSISPHHSSTATTQQDI